MGYLGHIPSGPSGWLIRFAFRVVAADKRPSAAVSGLSVGFGGANSRPLAPLSNRAGANPTPALADCRVLRHNF